MESWMEKLSGKSYALMRFVFGVLFACHGAQKLFGLFGGKGFPSESLMIAAGFIEFLCGILVALGLWAGYAAFIASGQMATAYFTQHSTEGFWPIVNNGELAVLYCFAFLYIASRGAGALSIDGLLKKRKP